MDGDTKGCRITLGGSRRPESAGWLVGWLIRLTDALGWLIVGCFGWLLACLLACFRLLVGWLLIGC